MSNEILLQQITMLCKKKGVNRTTAFVESGVGKNFASNLKTAGASEKNLKLLARYFDVTVGYLLGNDTEETLAAKAMGEVVEWLIDNQYEVEEDENGTYTISKGGKSMYYANCDFVTESLRIKSVAAEGFELAMSEWGRKHFSTRCELNEQEQTLLRLFRETTEEGRFEMISAFMQIKKDIEKKNTSTDTRSVG